MKKVISLFNGFLCILSFICITTKSDYVLKASNVEEVSNSVLIDTDSNEFTVEFLSKTRKFSLNSLGSCGYQAINIMLNYYDSFWNDGFIDESKEVRSSISSLSTVSVSPGSIYDDISDKDVSSSNEYYNKLSDNNVMKTLISIGIKKGFTKLSYSTKESFGLMPKEIVDIFKEYLNNYTTISSEFYFYSNYYSSGSITDKSKVLRSEIIRYVSAGYPVLVTGQNQKNGHAFVAYDYDSSSNTIFAHYGYKYSKFHQNFEEDYQTITGICLLMPKELKTHQHSDNYLMNNVSYCSCKLSSHHHKNTYIAYRNNHKTSCYCGVSYYENHFLNLSYDCIYCNRHIDKNTDYGALASLEV